MWCAPSKTADRGAPRGSVRGVRIATWNVNSLKARQDRVDEWLAYAKPDVVCLQETKLADKNFPHLQFQALGYDSVHHGHNQWNGVAILSRVGIEDVTQGFDRETVDPYEGDARLIAATCGGVRTASLQARSKLRVAVARADDIDRDALVELREHHHLEDR